MFRRLVALVISLSWAQVVDCDDIFKTWGTGGWSRPTALCLDQNYNIHVVDSALVSTLNTQTGQKRARGDLTTPPTTFVAPNAVASNGAGTQLYVVDYSHLVYFINVTAGTSAILYAASSAINGVAVDAKGNVFISDSARGVRRIDGVTGAVTSADDLAKPPVKYQYPLAVAVDPFGNLLTTEWVADAPASVRLLNVTSGSVQTLGLSAAIPFSATINGAAIDRFGNVFLSDQGNNRIARIDAKTGVVTSVATAAVPAISDPSGVAVTAEGHLFWVDSTVNPVREMVPPSEPPSPSPQPSPLPSAPPTRAAQVLRLSFTLSGLSLVTLQSVAAQKTLAEALAASLDIDSSLVLSLVVTADSWTLRRALAGGIQVTATINVPTAAMAAAVATSVAAVSTSFARFYQMATGETVVIRDVASIDITPTMQPTLQPSAAPSLLGATAVDKLLAAVGAVVVLVVAASVVYVWRNSVRSLLWPRVRSSKIHHYEGDPKGAGEEEASKSQAVQRVVIKSPPPSEPRPLTPAHSSFVGLTPITPKRSRLAPEIGANNPTPPSPFLDDAELAKTFSRLRKHVSMKQAGLDPSNEPSLAVPDSLSPL